LLLFDNSILFFLKCWINRVFEIYLFINDYKKVEEKRSKLKAVSLKAVKIVRKTYKIVHGTAVRPSNLTGSTVPGRRGRLLNNLLVGLLKE
jgi:hypothetical protein